MALDLPERKCEWEPCGVIIKTKRRGQKYHSKKCRVAHYMSRSWPLSALIVGNLSKSHEKSPAPPHLAGVAFAKERLQEIANL